MFNIPALIFPLFKIKIHWVVTPRFLTYRKRSCEIFNFTSESCHPRDALKEPRDELEGSFTSKATQICIKRSIQSKEVLKLTHYKTIRSLNPVI